jgi:putative copper export protein
MSLSRWILWLHLLGAMFLVGGQLVLTWLVSRPTRDREARAHMIRMDADFRKLSIVVLTLTIALGAIVTRESLVSSALLTTTPYGPILAAKLSLTLIWLILLVFAPRPSLDGGGASSAAARWWSVVLSGVAIGVVLVTGLLQSV